MYRTLSNGCNFPIRVPPLYKGDCSVAALSTIHPVERDGMGTIAQAKALVQETCIIGEHYPCQDIQIDG
jgi:hypothetical protein